MRKLFFSVIIILLFEGLFQNCANPSTPTGGPKDSIPPALISSTPADQSLNFKGQTITLTFDEFVAADKLKQSLIITPITENKYKHLVKKRTVTLKFDEPFEDSTTYTLNFFDGITDITEKTPAENLILAFSTGNYIDSLSIFGNVKDLFTNKPKEKITVALYKVTDSLDIFLNKPTYFYNTDETGVYKIQNIKNGKYRLIAFGDENRNQLFDGKESYGFLSDTLHLTESIEDSVLIKTVSINASPLKLISGRPATRYFSARYSKPIVSYTLSDSTPGSAFATDFADEKKESILFYNNLSISENDSVQTIVTARDSLGNKRTDTLYVKFREYTRKVSEFKSNLKPGTSAPIFPGKRYGVSFNKPIKIADSAFSYLKIDTLYNVPIKPDSLKSNFNNTSVSFLLPELNQDFIQQQLDTFKNELIGDSTNVDSATLVLYNKLDEYPTNRFQLHIKPGTFISVEQDTSEAINGTYNFGSNENFGVIRINLTTDKPAYHVQIMKENQVIKTEINCKKCVFQRVPAGEYWVRILIDENQDGEWSVGNILENREPEPIIYFPEKTNIRANWENELQYSF